MIEDKIIYNDYWERLQEKDKEIEKLNNDATHLIELHKKTIVEKDKLHSIIKGIKKDIEVIEQLEDIEVIKMQLRQLIFRLKDSDKE